MAGPPEAVERHFGDGVVRIDVAKAVEDTDPAVKTAIVFKRLGGDASSEGLAFVAVG